MEHLFLPRGAKVELVPYTGSRDYIGLSFRDYARKSNRGHLVQDQLQYSGDAFRSQHQNARHETQSFLETWLFCCLLQEMFSTVSQETGSPNLYRHEDFVRQAVVGDLVTTEPSTGRAEVEGTEISRHEEESFGKLQDVFHTAELVPRLDEWSMQLQGHTRNCQGVFEHLMKCLNIAFKVLVLVSPVFDTKSKLVITTVAETLTVAITRAFQSESFFDKDAKSSFLQLGWTEFGISKLKDNGWCPAESSAIWKQVTFLQPLYFMAYMKRQYLTPRHWSCSSGNICSGFKPLAELQHRHPNCRCLDDLSIKERDKELRSRMLEIIDNEQTALLEVSIKESNQYDVSFVPYTPGCQYVALSHVWVDGLGNPDANILPKCQIDHVFGLVKALLVAAGKTDENRFYLWIDTLCCPVAPESARSKVISELRNIYKSAAHVLVLDSELQQVDNRGMHVLEMGMRVLKSDWMKRLWTFQEGYLAQSVWVQFRQEAVNLDQLDIINIDTEPFNRRHIATYVRVMYKGLRRKLVEGSEMSSGTFTILNIATQTRQVTKVEDEPVCLATLLGLDTHLIATTEPAERMERFWGLMAQVRGGIPRSIIFRTGPKINSTGYRWAPSTFLEQSHAGGASFNTFSDIETSMPGDGTRSAKGLHVHFRGAVLSKVGPIWTTLQPRWGLLPSDKLANEYRGGPVRDQHGRWYMVAGLPMQVAIADFSRLDLSPNDPQFLLHGPQMQPLPVADAISGAGPRQFAVIFRNDLPENGLFVKIQEERDNIIYVRSLYRVMYSKVKPQQQQTYELALQAAKKIAGYMDYQTYAILADWMDGDFGGMAQPMDSSTPEDAAESERKKVLLKYGVLRAAERILAEHPGIAEGMGTSRDMAKGYMIVLIRHMLGNCFHFEADDLPETQQWCVD